MTGEVYSTNPRSNSHRYRATDILITLSSLTEHHKTIMASLEEGSAKYVDMVASTVYIYIYIYTFQ